MFEFCGPTQFHLIRDECKSERYQANTKDKNKLYISVETPFDNSRMQVLLFPV